MRNNQPYRFEDALQIYPQGSDADVLHVVHDLLLRLQVIAAVHLRQASQARLHDQPVPEAMDIGLKLVIKIGSFRPRPHQTHVSLENIPRLVSAICAAPIILAQLGITEGKQAVVYPGLEEKMGSARMQDANAVRDGRVLTGRAPGAAVDFGLMLLETLKDAETAARVRAGLVYTH